jgi:hypothetical protein
MKNPLNNQLVVLLDGRVVGTVASQGGRLSFAYTKQWTEDPDAGGKPGDRTDPVRPRLGFVLSVNAFNAFSVCQRFFKVRLSPSRSWSASPIIRSTAFTSSYLGT